MSIAVSAEPQIKGISISDESITAFLMDGRTVSVPLSWSWRLSAATPEERGRFEIMGSGQGVRWPDLDEDISVEGMLGGMTARRPPNRR